MALMRIGLREQLGRPVVVEQIPDPPVIPGWRLGPAGRHRRHVRRGTGVVATARFLVVYQFSHYGQVTGQGDIEVNRDPLASKESLAATRAVILATHGTGADSIVILNVLPLGYPVPSSEDPR